MTSIYTLLNKVHALSMYMFKISKAADIQEILNKTYPQETTIPGKYRTICFGKNLY
ncbi:hypothetical protein X975_24388, partial [Stegodyphus mimosarum]